MWNQVLDPNFLTALLVLIEEVYRLVHRPIRSILLGRRDARLASHHQMMGKLAERFYCRERLSMIISGALCGARTNRLIRSHQKGIEMVEMAKKQEQTMLLVTDRSSWSQLAAHVARKRRLHLTHLVWERGEPSPEHQLSKWKGDWIIGFKADYIVPPDRLAHASKGAINFHPGPPSIRGIGAYEVALDQKRRSYGVTCHHMVERADAGPIIKVRQFRIDGFMDAAELRDVAGAEMLALFLQILHLIVNMCPLPVSTSTWSGPLHTWKEFDARGEIVDAHLPVSWNRYGLLADHHTVDGHMIDARKTGPLRNEGEGGACDPRLAPGLPATPAEES